MTSNYLLFLLNKYPDLPWDWERISGNPNIKSFCFVCGAMDWYWVSKRPDVTFQDVLNYPDSCIRRWNWKMLSRNLKITVRDVLSYPNLPWDWDELSRNRSITFKDVMDHLNIIEHRWNWEHLSAHLDIPFCS